MLKAARSCNLQSAGDDRPKKDDRPLRARLPTALRLPVRPNRQFRHILFQGNSLQFTRAQAPEIGLLLPARGSDTYAARHSIFFGSANSRDAASSARVKNGPRATSALSPFYSQLRTLVCVARRSLSGQKRSFARPSCRQNPLNWPEPTCATHFDRPFNDYGGACRQYGERAADFLVDRADACQSPRTTPDAELLWYQRAAPPWNGRMVLRVKFAGTVSAAAGWICIISSWFAKTASAMA